MSAGDSMEEKDLFVRVEPDQPLMLLTSWEHVRELLLSGPGRLEFNAGTGRPDTKRIAVVSRSEGEAGFHVELRVEIAGILLPSLRLRMDGTIEMALQMLHLHFADMASAHADKDVDVIADEPALAGGQVLVHTESGTQYELNLGARYLRRIPGTEPSPDPEVAPASHLRRDGTVLKILRIHALQVGKRAIFDLEPLGDPSRNLFTRRTTTIVTGIDALDGVDHESQ